MVSSKCCQVVSPSPLRFLAALMPPCAHTECDRLTGTIENKSTWPPASAILMVAAKPESPPPTTIILGVVAINLFNQKDTKEHKGLSFYDFLRLTRCFVAIKNIENRCQTNLGVPSCPLWLNLMSTWFHDL